MFWLGLFLGALIVWVWYHKPGPPKPPRRRGRPPRDPPPTSPGPKGGRDPLPSKRWKVPDYLPSEWMKKKEAAGTRG